MLLVNVLGPLAAGEKVTPEKFNQLLSLGEKIGTSGNVSSEKMLPNLDVYGSDAPPGSFFYSFYLDHLNTFIHVAATEALVPA